MKKGMDNLPVITAKTAGFCFGVKRAVNIVTEEADKGRPVYTIGPIIHNPQMVDALSKKGVRIVDDVSQVPPTDKAVIRSHGVHADVYRQLSDLGIEYIDATCPYVKKIHKIVEQYAGTDTVILIAGDQNHPEVVGIRGHCGCPNHAFSNAKELENFIYTRDTREPKENWGQLKIVLIAQTTFDEDEWGYCVQSVKKVCTNLSIFDTICKATSERQQEARGIAQKADLMIVVGGKNSSNTTKLYHICSQFCRTVLIETAADLKGLPLGNTHMVGITAGASTPAFIIKEVQETMSEILSNQQDEMSFEEMLEQSFKTIDMREKVTAVVTTVKPNEIAVDIGTKHAGYVPLSELTDDPNAKAEDLVKVGDELELMVIRVNDVEGTVMLSKKRLDAIAGFEKVMNAAETGEVLEGTVVEVVKGGVLALTNGVRVFIPASQATLSHSDDLNELLKQEVRFKILEVNRQRRRAVGSIKSILKEERKELENAFWTDVEEGKVYHGTVKSLTNYGVFVNLGGVDGMIHISELSWQRVKHPSEIVKVGDSVEVYIKDINRETRKISLGYKKTEDNPWEILKNKYQIGDIVTCKIVSLTTFGAFAQILPGVDGLIHISQIARERIEKPADVLSVGQEIEVKITDIDMERKRISLSAKALLADDEEEPQSDADDIGIEAAQEASTGFEQPAVPEETAQEVTEVPVENSAKKEVQSEEASDVPEEIVDTEVPVSIDE